MSNSSKQYSSGSRPDSKNEFSALLVSVDKPLAHFATRPDTVLGLFRLDYKAVGLEGKCA